MSIPENIQHCISQSTKDKLNDFLDSIHETNNFYPQSLNIFQCFSYFPLEKTKVVILGQDPYINENQATGLAFGVPQETKIPPSLRNIIKNYESTTGQELDDITLESWAKDGYLLLNTALTVEKGKSGSHLKQWKNFTQEIIEYIQKNCLHVIFVAWGALAYEYMRNIPLAEFQKLYVSSHPSPLSYKKKLKEFPSFEESTLFQDLLEIL